MSMLEQVKGHKTSSKSYNMRIIIISIIFSTVFLHSQLRPKRVEILNAISDFINDSINKNIDCCLNFSEMDSVYTFNTHEGVIGVPCTKNIVDSLYYKTKFKYCRMKTSKLLEYYMYFNNNLLLEATKCEERVLVYVKTPLEYDDLIYFNYINIPVYIVKSVDNELTLISCILVYSKGEIVNCLYLKN